MPKNHIPILVVLDKSEKHDNTYRPYNFGSTPRLYLELLENKGKVRPELRDKEYIPPPEFMEQEQKAQAKRSEVTKEEEKHIPSVTKHEEGEHRGSKHHDAEDRSRDHGEGRHRDRHHKEHRHKHHHKEHKDDEEDKHHHKHHHRKHGERSSRIREILKTSHKKGSHEKTETETKKVPPPSLAELESGMKGDGRFHVSQYASTGSTEELARKKILLRKLDLLRQRNSSIPTYTEISSLDTLERDTMIYERQTQIETSIDSYKKYLIVAFTGIEWFIGYMIGLDARGLADSQMKNMHPYEDLLVELSEKTYVEPDRRYPVELRLALAVMLNTVFFIMTKMITESMTKNFGNFMPPPSPSPQHQKPSQTRMRGPNSDDLSDILGQSPSPKPSPGVLPETLRRRSIPGIRPEMKKNN